MSSRRQSRRNSVSSTEEKKKKTPSNPDLENFKNRFADLRAATKVFNTKVNNNIGGLSGDQKIILITEVTGKNGKTKKVRSQGYSRKEVSKMGTQLLRAMEAVQKMGVVAVATASKKSPNTGNLQVGYIKKDHLDFFNNVLEAAGISDEFGLTGDTPHASPSLLQKIIMVYIYQNKLHKNITNILTEKDIRTGKYGKKKAGDFGKTKINKDVPENKWNRSRFVVDETLSEILQDKNGVSAKVGDQLAPIKVTSMLTNILRKAKGLGFPAYEGKAADKSEPGEHNQLTRYVLGRNALIEDWKSDNKGKVLSSKVYSRIVDEAARDVLADEGITVAGSVTAIGDDTKLLKKNKALYWSAVVDSEVHQAELLLSKLKKKK